VKRLIFIALLLPTMALASSLSDFMSGVRLRTRLNSQTMLDSANLREISARAIQYVSTEAGGFESGFKITTVAGQSFYRIPDSTVQILYASIVSNGYTLSIKSYPPEYVEGDLKLERLEGTDQNAVPRAYKWWNDSIQLIPTPVKADPIYFSTYVRHSFLTLAAATVHLKGDFWEAAQLYACYIVWYSLDEYDKGDKYLALYKVVSDRAKQTAARKIDSGLKGENKQ